MSTLPTPGHATRIAGVELRRGFRKLRDRNPVQLLALALVVLFGVLATAAVTLGAYVAGDRLAAGEVADPSVAATIAAAAVWIMAFTLTAYITALQLGDVDHRDGLLTTVPHRDLVGGLMLAGAARVLGPFVPPAVVAAVAFGAGAGSAGAVVLLVVAVASVAGSAYVAGFAVGLAVKFLLGRSETVARHKVALGVLAFAAYMGVLLTNTLGDLIIPVVNALRDSPVAWYADLALLALAPTASPIRAAGALAGTGLLAGAGLVAAVRVAEMLWYADPVVADDGRTESAVETGRLDHLVDRPTGWVVRKAWLRARRAPIKLLYVVYPLFLLFTPVQASLEAGHAVPSLPATLAIYGAWATGAAFTLNVLGDEGGVLPVTLTTAVSGRQFVGGLVLAGVVLGVPVTVAATLVAGLLSPLSLPAVAATVAAAAVLPAGAAALATGVGVLFPKFDTSKITRNREVVVPSIWAFAAYSLALLLLGAPATAAQVPVITAFVADAANASPLAVRAAGLAVSTVAIGAAAFASYRFAVGRFEEFTVD